MQRNAVAALGIALCLSGCGASDMAPDGQRQGAVTVVPPVNNNAVAAGTGGKTGTAVPGGVIAPAIRPMMGVAGGGSGMTGVGTGGSKGGAGGTTAAGSGGTTATPAMGSGEPRIPTATEPCPTLATGNITVKGQNVQLWVGAKSAEKTGPVFFYWHGTGSFPGEAAQLGAALTEIQSLGGLVASFDTSLMTGQNTGNNVWYTGDFEMADEILACAVEQLNIDVRRIYTGGCSAGGLQSGAMVYGRSSYIAGAMPNSGGTVFPYQLEDPSHVPALITTHGAAGTDVVVIDFADTSATETKDIASKGGFAVDCDHGGSHCGSPADVTAAQWQFLKDHPFGISPEPYASGLPASFPAVCKIIM